ncbi:sphingomyelin phosphodiesterase-like [Physella acuta]|uniref:sphingomyelin phosphodiesterase-like n=1 Tax=Physella acuta TaxID=109671 RepID=UPI0027DD6FD8|nr:sphingomyelin phosphodiesterase-like [Physella acuta]
MLIHLAVVTIWFHGFIHLSVSAPAQDLADRPASLHFVSEVKDRPTQAHTESSTHSHLKQLLTLCSPNYSNHPHNLNKNIQELCSLLTSFTTPLDQDLNFYSLTKRFTQWLSKEVVNNLLPTFDLRKRSCDECKIVVAVVQYLASTNVTTEFIKSTVYTVCSKWGFETPRVCHGLVEEFAAEVLTVFNGLALSPDELCALVFHPHCGSPYNPHSDWNVTFPNKPQPPYAPPTPPKAGAPTLRVLHLTDIHYDSEYQVGSNADCGEPLCCRRSSGPSGKPGAGAWKFGDYRKCDTPLWTLEDMFSTLAQDKFDYIIWTGDLPAHNVWNQSRSDQVELLKALVKLIQQYFPGTLVLASLGNHESSPVNSFPPPYIQGDNSISWLYEALADSWKQWLPESALESVRRGAYYTVTPYPGLKVISLNMNYCNNQNWWMLLNATDPAGELQWLVDTLQTAEDEGVKVHILGHIPPGNDDCLKPWSWNYYRIVSRYRNTIAGQFFGHTHFDSFTVYYDVETLKVPVGVAYVAPSVTPYSDLNMGYRIYTIDGDYQNSSFQVLDHQTHYLNLTRAQVEGQITWELEYSAKLAYNMTSLYPADWDKLIQDMQTDSKLLNLYNKYYFKSRYSGACDKECRKQRLCEALSGRSHDPGLCKSLGVHNMEDWISLTQQKPKHC